MFSYFEYYRLWIMEVGNNIIIIIDANSLNSIKAL